MLLAQGFAGRIRLHTSGRIVRMPDVRKASAMSHYNRFHLSIQCRYSILFFHKISGAHVVGQKHIDRG